MQPLLDVSRLWQAIALTLSAGSLSFVVALAAGMQELGGGAPAWLNIVAFALMGVSAVTMVWTSVLLIKWLVLKLAKR